MSLRIFYTSAAIALLSVLSACHKTPEPEPNVSPTVNGEKIIFPANSPQQTALATAAVATTSAEKYRLNGRLTWNEDSTVRVYSPVAGRVHSVSVAAGAQVAQDAPLAELKSPELGQAQADFRKAEADLQLADRTLSRVKDLFEHGAFARKDVEAAENGYISAQAERQRAAARLALYGAEGGNEVDGMFVLHSPLAGTVVEKNINLGQEVRPDQMLANVAQLAAPLFVVTNPLRLSVILDATERDLAVLKPGLPFTVHSSSMPDRSFAGQITWVADSLDPTTRRVAVRGQVENPDRLLKGEMFVTVEFELTAPTRLIVPTKAVIMKGEKHFIFVEEKPGTYVRREVEIGPEQEGMLVIRQGIEANQQVVTDGSVLLEELHSSATGS